MARTDTKENAMDYPEHEKTYAGFLKLTKWGIILNICLLLGMAISFFGFGTGMIMAIFLTIILSVISYFVFGS